MYISLSSLTFCTRRFLSCFVTSALHRRPYILFTKVRRNETALAPKLTPPLLRGSSISNARSRTGRYYMGRRRLLHVFARISQHICLKSEHASLTKFQIVKHWSSLLLAVGRKPARLKQGSLACTIAALSLAAVHLQTTWYGAAVCRTCG